MNAGENTSIAEGDVGKRPRKLFTTRIKTLLIHWVVPPVQAEVDDLGVFGFADLLSWEKAWIRDRAQKRRASLAEKHAQVESAIEGQVSDNPEVRAEQLGDGGAKPDESNGKAQATKPTRFEAAEIGLAISGGGARSATYALGVLQGMARTVCGNESLLGQLGYVSSVSGGSYINSWFSTWVSRASFKSVQNALADELGETSGNVSEAQTQRYVAQQPISHLRQYSSYLSPQSGAFTADTWTAIAGYLVRLLPNLLFVVSVAVAAVIAPYLLRDWIRLATNGRNYAWLAAAASMLLALALVWLPVGELKFSDAARSRKQASNGAAYMFGSCVLITPFVAWLGVKLETLFLTSAAMVQNGKDAASVIAWFGGYFYTHDRGAGVAMVIGICLSVTGFANLLFSAKAGGPESAWERALGGVWSTLAGSATLFAVIVLMAQGFAKVGRDWENALTCVLPLLLIGVYLAISSVYMYRLRLNDESQEWLNRIWGGAASLTVLWFMGSGLVILVPWLITSFEGYLRPVWPHEALRYQLTCAGVIVGWLGTTIASVMSAYSGKTGGQKPADTTAVPPRMRRKQEAGKHKAISVLASAAPYFVVFGGLALLAFFGTYLCRLMRDHGLSSDWTKLQVCAACVAIAVTLAARMDVNRLSMHNVYRFRLGECYLDALDCVGQSEGSAKLPRCAEMSVSHLGESDGPYPIINSALNVTKKGELTLQKRKALNFVFTPGFCGFHYAKRDTTKKLEARAYRKSSEYASERKPLISLDERRQKENRENWRSTSCVLVSEAMAISGAAQSPNEGNHTSPAVAVLLSMFNIRLGAWVGNPRHKKGWRKFPATNGGKMLWDELLAQANDEQEFVYLSDGGHFENLGIYELVRRRCRIIFCSDADCDSTYEFKDLLNAMERCSVDFNATIKIDTSRLRRFGRSGYSRMPFAVGTIAYADGREPGVLVLFKPAVTRASSAMVQDYDSSNKAYPHEPTANQWFDEEQFEAYRLIGLETAVAFGEALKSAQVPGGCDPEAWKILRSELL